MDMHGHGHSIQRLELGNLLSDANLNLTDAQLDADPAHEDASSIRMMSEQDAANSFSAVLRGSTSLGTLCASEGFPSIPSSGDPSPNGDPYFNGGHYTQFYGCRTGGMLCGVQIEANYSGVRDNATNRGALPRRPGGCSTRIWRLTGASTSFRDRPWRCRPAATSRRAWPRLT